MEYQRFEGPGFDRAQAITMEALERAARRLGLYLDHGRVMGLPQDPTTVLVFADFAIGDLAFSDSVQAVDEAESKTWRSLKRALEDDDVNRQIDERRRQLGWDSD